MSYESIKIYDVDYAAASEAAKRLGVPVIEYVGRCIEGWPKLSRPKQDEVVRDRGVRRLAAEAETNAVAGIA